MTYRQKRRQRQIHQAVGKWMILCGQAAILCFAVYSMLVVGLSL